MLHGLHHHHIIISSNNRKIPCESKALVGTYTECTSASLALAYRGYLEYQYNSYSNILSDFDLSMNTGQGVIVITQVTSNSHLLVLWTTAFFMAKTHLGASRSHNTRNSSSATVTGALETLEKYLTISGVIPSYISSHSWRLDSVNEHLVLQTRL